MVNKIASFKCPARDWNDSPHSPHPIPTLLREKALGMREDKEERSYSGSLKVWNVRPRPGFKVSSSCCWFSWLEEGPIWGLRLLRRNDAQLAMGSFRRVLLRLFLLICRGKNFKLENGAICICHDEEIFLRKSGQEQVKQGKKRVSSPVFKSPLAIPVNRLKLGAIWPSRNMAPDPASWIRA